MRFGEAFAAFSAMEPDNIDWDSPFDWVDADTPELLEAIWTVQVSTYGDTGRLAALTAALAADLHSQRKAQMDEATQNVIDCARFISCMPMLQATGSAGQIGACYNWVWTAVSPTHDAGTRVNENLVSFLNLPGAPEALMRQYFDYVPNFAAAAFHVAYRLGGLDELAEMIVDGCWALSLRLIEVEPMAPMALVQMTVWASHKDNRWAKPFAAELEALLAQALPGGTRKTLMMAFITPAHRYTSRTPPEWARRLLDDHGTDLTQHERLQVLGVLISDAKQWQDHRREVLEEIAALRSLYVDNLGPGESGVEVLEARVNVLHALISGLARWGGASDVLSVLRAWYSAQEPLLAEDDSLVVVPTHEGGASYLWPGGRLLTGTGGVSDHDAMQRAASKALGSYYRGQDGDHHPDEFADTRFDVIDSKAGYDWIQAMRRHYRLDQLVASLPAYWTPGSVVVFPSGPEPLQALLAADIGIAAPFEASFERPAAERPVRRVSVWAAGLMHQEFEIDAIRHVARRAGWSVSVHDHDAPTRDDFRAFYEDPDADVLWVISHGAHDPFTISATGLNIDHGEFLPLEWLRSLSVARGARRLLVLNTCSGATTQGRGGAARIGVAQLLASADQAVIGNLWPIHWSVGLAFGATLAACLSGVPTRAAFFKASELMRDPAAMMANLRDEFADLPDLIERLEWSGEDMASPMAWACPVFLT